MQINKGVFKLIRVHYCTALKSTGKPIIVNIDGKETNTDLFEMKNVDVRIKYNNAVSKEKRSGATTILEVFPR